MPWAAPTRAEDLAACRASVATEIRERRPPSSPPRSPPTAEATEAWNCALWSASAIAADSAAVPIRSRILASLASYLVRRAAVA